jgi:hypothetical protein
LPDGEHVVDQLLGGVVRQRLAPEILGVAVQLRGDAAIDRLQILLILVVDRPEPLGLGFRQLHVAATGGAGRRGSLPQDLQVVRRRISSAPPAAKPSNSNAIT